MIDLKIKKLLPAAITPTYATDGSACFDIYSIDSIALGPDSSVVVSTGLSFEIPEGYVMLVYSRSGHGFKYDVRLANCVGVIDSDYRGELRVKLTCDTTDNSTLHVIRGDRIAQGMLVPYPKVNFVEVDELSDTKRGTGGLGSTGK